jgi:hypothetical protein
MQLCRVQQTVPIHAEDAWWGGIPKQLIQQLRTTDGPQYLIPTSQVTWLESLHKHLHGMSMSLVERIYGDCCSVSEDIYRCRTHWKHHLYVMFCFFQRESQQEVQVLFATVDILGLVKARRCEATLLLLPAGCGMGRGVRSFYTDGGAPQAGAREEVRGNFATSEQRGVGMHIRGASHFSSFSA